MKEKLKLRLWVKVAIILILMLFAFIGIKNATRKRKDTKVVQTTIKEEKAVREEMNYELESVEELKEIEQEEIEEPIIEYSNVYETRMTSYYPEEGETMTASGLGIDDFGINENGWFTYNGRIVIATASTRLGYTDMRTYNLYDELIVNIEGIDYQAIVLDVCGACQRDNRIDLFASSVIYAKDTIVEVKIR